MLAWIFRRMMNVSDNNPIWQLEMRRDGKRINRLRREAGTVATAILAVVGIFLIGQAFLLRESFSFGILALVFGLPASAIAMLGADLAYMITTFGSFDTYRPYRDGELILITSLAPQRLVEAKYHAALSRTWSTFLIEFTLRGIVSASYTLLILMNLEVYSQFADVLLSVCLAGLIVAAYVSEPYFRAKTVVALGIALAALHQGQSVNVVFALAVNLLMRAIQVGYLMLVVGGSNFLEAVIFENLTYTLRIIFQLLYYVTAAAGGLAVYMMLERAALRFAENRVLRAEA